MEGEHVHVVSACSLIKTVSTPGGHNVQPRSPRMGTHACPTIGLENATRLGIPPDAQYIPPLIDTASVQPTFPRMPACVLRFIRGRQNGTGLPAPNQRARLTCSVARQRRTEPPPRPRLRAALLPRCRCTHGRRCSCSSHRSLGRASRSRPSPPDHPQRRPPPGHPARYPRLLRKQGRPGRA